MPKSSKCMSCHWHYSAPKFSPRTTAFFNLPKIIQNHCLYPQRSDHEKLWIVRYTTGNEALIGDTIWNCPDGAFIEAATIPQEKD